METLIKKLAEAEELTRKKKSRVIGWGTGSVFDAYFAQVKNLLVYLVDSNPALWGTKKRGLDIFEPGKILRENPERLLIIICSSFTTTIEEQIISLGNFNCISVQEFTIPQRRLLKLRKIHTYCNEAVKRHTRRRRSKDVILVQGPIHPEYTLACLKLLQLTAPDSKVLFSTWEDCPDTELSLCRRWVDLLVTSKKPTISGTHNRNLQSISTKIGLALLNEEDFDCALKIRSDFLVTKPNVLTASAALSKRFPINKSAQSNLKQRILISSSFTRLFIPFHPSDMIMFGKITDLIQFWDQPHDLMQRNHILDETAVKGLYLDLIPNEVYYAHNFVKKFPQINFSNPADSIKFFAELFIVVDDSFFRFVWKKFPAGIVHPRNRPALTCINFGIWQELLSTGLSHYAAYRHIIEKLTWGSVSKIN